MRTMKLWRKLILPLASALVMGLLVGPLAPPAAANLLQAAMCTVVGRVDLSIAAGVLPPGSTMAATGTYAFVSVVITCVGAPGLPNPNGEFSASSNGSTNGLGSTLALLLTLLALACPNLLPAPGTGTFCGDYILTALSGATLGCSGQVGGSLLLALPPEMHHSMTVGLLIEAHISCTIDLHIDSDVTLGGLLSLVAEPDNENDVLVLGPVPLANDGCDWPNLSLLLGLLLLLGDPTGGLLLLLLLEDLLTGTLLMLLEPELLPLLGQDPRLVGFCGIIVEGTAVFPALPPPPGP